MTTQATSPAVARAAAARTVIEQHLLGAADVACRLGCRQLGNDLADLAAYCAVMRMSADELAELAVAARRAR